MNKIYKSIWNHVTRTFTAVSEITVTRKKRALSKSIVLAGMIASMGVQTTFAFDGDEEGDWMAGSSGGTTIYLYNNDNRPGTYDFLHPWVIGGENAARDYTDLTASRPGLIFNKYRLHVTEEGATLNLDDWKGSLIDQSNHGLSQIVVKADDWHGGNTDAHHFVVVNDSRDASEDTYVQALRQTDVNGQASDIGTATYVMGGAAVNKLGTTVDGKPHSEETGIHDNDGDGSYSEGLYVAMLLRAVNITQDKVLTLNITGDDDNIWAAQVHGQGGITYSGESSESTKVILQDKYNFGTNDYYGPTNIGSITLDLNRTNAFGQASFITASDAVINVNQSDAWTSAGELHLTDSTVNFTAAQSGFTVTNDNSEETTNTATFSGANTISGGANSFTYLIRGDAQVVDGTTTFAGTNIKTQVAGSLILHSVGGIANDTAIEIGGALNFVGAGATPTKQTLTQTFAAYDDTDDKYTVNLSEGSNIKYSSGQILSGVSETKLSDASRLETDTQANLGAQVTFAREGDEARSQLTLTGDGGLTLATNLTGDGLTILDAGQDDGTNAQISLDSGVDLSNYSGWIRLQNGTMSLTADAANKLNTDNGIQTGLSLGSGSTLVINDTTGAQIIENFGWSTASAGGVLDLSGFTFTGTKDAALTVDSIQVGASNVIRVDIAKLAVDANVQEGYILDLDNSNPTQLLVSGTLSDSESAGRGSQDFVLVGLEEAEDSPETGDDKHYKFDQTLFSSNSGETVKQNAAIATWDVDADYYSAGANGVEKNGVYLNYSIKSLTLLNGTEVLDEDDPVIDETQPLHWNAALVANAGNDNRLTANVHGYGILQVNNNRGTVYLDGNKSDYKGATVVTGSTTLDSTYGALGQSVLVLTDISNYVLRQGSDATVDQRLNGIVTDSGSHTINVNRNTIEIVGQGLTADSASNMASGYGNNTGITAGNVLGANTKLSGGGIFSIGSDDNQETGISLTAKSANAFNGYDGTVRLAGTGSSLTIVGDADLTDGTFATTNNAANAANAAITVDTNATIDEDNADFSGYKGTLNTTNHTYTVTSIGALGGASIVADGSTIILNGITNEGQAVAFNTAISKNGVDSQTDNPNRLIIQSSNIEINADSENKKGVDVVQIGELSAEQNDPNSILTLVSGTTDSLGGLADGGLGKFSSNENSLNVAFVGNGNLNLSGYTLSSDQLDFTYQNGEGGTETFTGTLGLLNSKYTLSGGATYSVDLDGDATLTAEGTKVSVQSFTFDDGATLDLTQVNNTGNSNPLFTANSYSGSGILNVTITDDQLKEVPAHLETNILDQDDETGANWFVAAGDASGITEENASIQVSGESGETGLSGSAEVTLQQGVTGTYELGTAISSGGIGVNYRLTELDVAQNAVGFALDAGNQTDADLAVKLTGTGSIGIGGTIEVAYQEGSEFAGKYALDTGAHLILSGENSGVAEVDFGAESNTVANLTLNSDQKLILGTVGSGSIVTLKDSEDNQVKLTVQGENVFADGSKLLGSDNTNLVLNDSAQLEVENVSTTFTGFEGGIGLGSESHLTLNGVAEGTSYSLDNINSSAADSTVTLGSGSYSLSESAYTGEWELGNSATLNLGDNVSFTANGAKLSSAEGVEDTTKPVVNVGENLTVTAVADNLAGFTNGTFTLGNESTLHINANDQEAFLSSGVNVSGLNGENRQGTLELAGSGTFNSNVTANTFSVASGNVTLGGSSISVTNTVVGVDGDADNEASLTAAKGQIGSSSLTIYEGGVLNVTVGEQDTGSFVQKISDEGTLHVDLGGKELNFTNEADAQNQGSQTTIIVANGTHTYDARDGFTNYGVDNGGVFKAGEGENEAPIGSEDQPLGSFTWQSNDNGGGELDLTGITYTGDPAMNVETINIEGEGSIKLDLESWVIDLEQTKDSTSNLLDADDGNNNYVVLVAGTVHGTVGSLTLKDKDGVPIDESGKYDTKTVVSGGIAHWNYGLTNTLKSDDPDAQKGLGLTYRVTELELTQNQENPNEEAVLDSSGASDSEFTAEVSGTGKLSIKGNVTLSHSGNKFTDSTVTVTSDSKLTTNGSNVLGSGSNTLKLDNANYEMAASAGSAYSETVTLDTDGDSTITLNGNTLELADESSISSGTTFSGNAESNANSKFVAVGGVTFESAADTLKNLKHAGLKLTIGADGDVEAKGGSILLENISDLGNSEAGKFTLALNQGEKATAGDLTDFTGTVVAGSGQTFVLTEGSVTDDVKVDLSNGGTLTSSTESTIAGLTTTSDSVIDLGEMTVVGENAGMLTVADGNSTLAQGTELKVEVNTDITSESVLSLDDGKFTKLVTGLGKDQRADFTIAQAGDETITGKLTNAGGGEIGTAHYDFTKTVTADGDEMAAGLTSTLTKIDLTGELVLSNSADTSADLNAEVQGTNESAVTVSFGEIELVKNNSYGQLNVNEGATANLTGVQTITGTEGVVAGQIEANAGKLRLASDASLTFKNVQTGLADVSLNNNATLTLSGLDLTDNSSLLGATKLNVVDGTGSLQIVDSTGLLDDDNLVFPASPDYKATALDIAVQNSEVTLSDNWVDITDNLSMDVTGGSSVTMAGKTSDALSVDWSNLTVDQDSNVTLNGNGAALTFTGLNEGKLAGTVNINNVGFEFGANTAGNSVNNDLLESANVTFSNSDLVANGVSNVGNLTLDSDTTLAFQESKEIAMGEASSSLITVNDGKTLNLGGATIKIDTDDLSFDFKDTESGTTSAPLLNALNDAQQENVKYFQLVEGNVSGLGELTDMNGNALVDTSAVTVIGEDGKTVAELGFGANLQQGEGGKDLWVGQGLQKLSLFKSVELNAGDGKGLTLDGNGVFTINAVIEASDKEGADDVIDLTIAGGTPIRLAGANGNITGTTTVAEDGKLILANNNTLGSQTDLDVQGTLEIETGFTQSAKTLNVSGTGTLDLAEGAKLDVTTAPEGSASAIIGGTVTGSGTLAFAENAQVHIAETAKLNSVTWDLTKGAAMVIAAGTNGQSITSGTISGGTVVKNGTGDLTLGYGVVNNNGVAVDVQEGNLKIDDWTNTLTLKSLNLHKSEFTMFGNLATADGLSADGARITLGASDTDFKDYTIDGLYSGSATFVFDTALGETSDGDSLTFADGDGVAEGSHALVEVNNHTTLRPSMSVADLTLISVNGEVAEDFATLQGGNLSKDGFDWGLVAKEGENGYTDFYLSAEAGSDPSDPTDPSKPVYKMDARVGALAGFAASVDLFEMTIHDRQGTRAWINPITGEKTTTSLWMRQTMSKSDSSDSSGQFGGRSDDRATTIGGDILQLSPSGSGLVYAGLMAGFGSSDYDANSSVTGASAKADTDAWMVGAYAGWNQNDPKNDRTGAYLAGWVQYAHFSSDIVRSGEKKLEAKASGLSASLEAGWIVKAAEFQMQGGATEGAFYIEPHAQVTWWGTDYDNIDGENIEFEGQHNITTRLGARLTMETSGATNFSPYLEANWVHNTKEYGVQWGEAESYIEGTQNQAELKFGAETFFTDSFSGYAQIRANWGGDGYNRQEGSLGLKYRF